MSAQLRGFPALGPRLDGPAFETFDACTQFLQLFAQARNFGA